MLTAGPSCSAFLPAADAVPAPNDTDSAREMTSIAIMTYVALFMSVTSFWLRTLAATRRSKQGASDAGHAGKHYQRWRTISRIQDTKAWTRPRRRGRWPALSSGWRDPHWRGARVLSSRIARRALRPPHRPAPDRPRASTRFRI